MLRASIDKRLGVQLLFDFSDVVDAVEFAAGNGFAALELNLGNVEFGRQLRSRRERERIRYSAQRLGVKLAFHALEGLSFFVPSARVRRCAMAELKQTLEQAAEVGARNVVMHLGSDMHYGMGGTNRYTHEQFPDYYEEALGNALAELRNYARSRSRLCVENVGGFRYPPTRPVLDRLLGRGLGLCLDAGHINILPPDRRRDELAFYRRHVRHIHHAHIHDNNGLRDEHLPLGQGRLDAYGFFRLLAETDALLVFETRPKEAALESLEYYRRELAPVLLRRSTGRRR